MHRISRVPGLLLCSLFLLVATAGAQTGQPVGTILIAHGADSGWNSTVTALAQQVHTGGPVAVAFLMGPEAKTHRFQDAVHQVVAAGASRVVVVPILVSSHSGHYEQVRFLVRATDTLDDEMRHHLMMSAIEQAPLGTNIVATTALDDAPELAQVLADRARTLATAPSEQAVMLVGHGPNSSEDNAAWMDNLRRIAESVKASGGFTDVQIGLLRDDAPAAVRAEAVLEIRNLIRLQAKATGHSVVVIPILVANGSMSRTTVPTDLAGLPIVYGNAALLPHPALARWVERMVREAAQPKTARAMKASH
ncbi:MAG: CbiX/SirB N-terminal domain-containing protein [Gemmatimonadota bacterium]